MTGPRLCMALLLVTAARAAAMGAQEGGKKPETVRVSGVVRLVGSGPVAELFISNEWQEWRVEGTDRDKLWKLQQQTVTVEGEERREQLAFADGRPAGERRYLGNITIIRQGFSTEKSDKKPKH